MQEPYVLYGTANGTVTDNDTFLYASQSLFTGSSQSNARFGSSIAVIDNDLIIGRSWNNHQWSHRSRRNLVPHKLKFLSKFYLLIRFEFD